MRRTAEVVIIGGGCMGASTAYHLAKRGLTDVVIIEREPMLGMGSTGRNAGGVRHQFSSEANVRLSIESIRMFERFEQETGYPIDFHQDGYLFLVSNEETMNTFRTAVEMQRRLGVEVDVLSPEDASMRAPGINVDGVIGATFCGRDGIADPNGVTMGFAKAAQALGVEVCRDAEVAGITVKDDRVAEVQTSKGTVATSAVVNAAGPWARRIAAMVGLDLPVFPFRRHIFVTEPIGKGREGGAPASRILVIDFETTFYFHREGAGILFGMSDPSEPSSFNTSVTWEFLEKVTPAAVRRLPILGELGIAHAWAGLYEVTPDAMPVIGRAPEIRGFFMINGFSGHGFQHSPAAGRILADIITDNDPGDLTPFTFERFSSGGAAGEVAVV